MDDNTSVKIMYEDLREQASAQFNEDELKALALDTTNKLFNTKLEKMNFTEDKENQMEYFTNSKVSSRVFGNTLEITTANSDLDFMNYINQVIDTPANLAVGIDDKGNAVIVGDTSQFTDETEPYGDEYKQSLNENN